MQKAFFQPVRHPFQSMMRLASVIALGGLVSVSVQAKDLVIGMMVPVTGGLAPLGADMKKGFELAVAQAGQINGNKIKLVLQDTQGNAAVSLQAAQKLVLQDKANVLIGVASSAETLALAGQIKRLNVPIVTTNSQAVQVTGAQCSKYIFRTNPNDAMMAQGNSLLMKRNPEMLQKKWFVIYHDFVWGKSNASEFEKIPGIKIVGRAGRPLGTADWSSAISEIQSSGADAIYLALSVGDDMPAFVTQARSFGLKQKMLPPLGMPDSMLSALGESSVGFITGGLFASWMAEDKSPQMASLNRAYYAAYKAVPGPQAIQAYVGMQWLLAGLRKTPSLDANDVIKTLEETHAATPLGDFAVRKEDHQGMVPLYVAEAGKLPTPKYGASYGWRVREELPWDSVKVDIQNTGCNGLH